MKITKKIINKIADIQPPKTALNTNLLAKNEFDILELNTKKAESTFLSRIKNFFIKKPMYKSTRILAPGRFITNELGQLEKTVKRRKRLYSFGLGEKMENVYQVPYKILKAGERGKEYIHTYGIGPCLGVTFYDPLTKTGALCHFSPNSRVSENIDKIMSVFKKNNININNIEARLVGNNTCCKEPISSVFESLENHRIKIVEQDIMGGPDRVNNIALDLKTGELFDL